MTTVQITLPDALAREAANAGLLTAEKLGQMLRERLRAGRVERLAEARAVVANKAASAMTSGEIAAEIAAYRNERRRAAGS